MSENLGNYKSAKFQLFSMLAGNDCDRLVHTKIFNAVTNITGEENEKYKEIILDQLCLLSESIDMQYRQVLRLEKLNKDIDERITDLLSYLGPKDQHADLNE